MGDIDREIQNQTEKLEFLKIHLSEEKKLEASYKETCDDIKFIDEQIRTLTERRNEIFSEGELIKAKIVSLKD